MIPRSKLKVQANTWQDELRTANISLPDLLESIRLSPNDFDFALLEKPEFKLKIPASFLARIKPAAPKDPLLLQILPRQSELDETAGFSCDPLCETTVNSVSGLIKKYPKRALLIASSNCPVHCRYCFRKNFNYADNHNLQPALSALRLDQSINEAILSGGDPLSLDNSKLKSLIQKLEDMPQIKTLRIHTRFPIAVPARVNSGLLEILANTRFNLVVVTHINHPQEIDNLAQEKLKLLSSYAILFNQTVLLAEINDNADIQIKLAQKLINCGVIPYYLHMLDKIQGAAHFAVKESKAREILQVMQDSLPGYLAPRLVREIAGRKSRL